MSSTTSLFVVAFCLLLLLDRTFSLDYKAALSKSLLYYEAQRSGKLPPNQRVQWRSDSGMKDGSDAGIDLVGGYYDGGDHVKYGFPMAFTVTMLAWSAVEFRSQLEANHELSNTLDAIKWGTDYFIKAHPKVGDVVSDYKCWQRPEDMTTPRTSYKIDEAHPGSDLAGETAAALAAAAIVFNKTDPAYSSQLLTHAKQLFDFATKYKGKYQNSILVADSFYTSTGYEDELLWAAAWLYRATLEKIYLDILHTDDSGCTRTIFNWDDKYVGSQVLVAKLVLDGTFNGSDGIWTTYQKRAEKFICNIVQKGNNNAQMTNGGLLWWHPWNDLQYTTSATFIVTAYSDYLTTANLSLQCPGGLVSSTDMIKFARSQVDYILGQNPRNTSYMVGFGSKYPQKIHHRGSSIISIKTNSTPVACKEGYDIWFKKNASNPNVLHGAVVRGPYKTDSYWDSRYNIMQGKPVTANTAPFVGVLARMA